MRICIGADQTDTTAAVQAYLQGTDHPLIRHLYLIGDPSGPNFLMTDHEAPIVYPPWGTFSPSVIKKGAIATKTGLEVQKVTLTWTPGNLSTGVTVTTASKLLLGYTHYFDNWPVRIWKCFLPSPGGLTQLSGCPLFGGRIGQCTVGRNQIEFSVASFLDVVTQKLPANVIESTATLASYTGATVPSGDANTPTFTVFDGSTTTKIYADCIQPTANRIYGTNVFVAGYIVFLQSAGSTLQGYWSAIGSNEEYTDGHANNHNQFDIYNALPWAPTPGVDTFYVSTAAPINIADYPANAFPGFPFVPQPTTAA